MILEPIQMEGGIYTISADWLQRLRSLTTRYGVVLICDEIQTGCGRSGTFFCFEQAGIRPDLVTVSKSIGGCGLPLSLLLIRPDLDVWEPGEHTGTFRGNQLAFVAAAEALERWREPSFLRRLEDSSRALQSFGQAVTRSTGLSVRGRGMILGIDTAAGGGARLAAAIQRHCFEHGLVLELCGRQDEVVKVMPALTISPDDLSEGLGILWRALETLVPAGSDRSAS